jgi:hypothetical protein
MFHADVNIQTYDKVYYYGKHRVLPSVSALHRVVARKHWWHINALQFLLNHSTNVNLLNGKGETPCML